MQLHAEASGTGTGTALDCQHGWSSRVHLGKMQIEAAREGNHAKTQGLSGTKSIGNHI